MLELNAINLAIWDSTSIHAVSLDINVADSSWPRRLYNTNFREFIPLYA